MKKIFFLMMLSCLALGSCSSGGNGDGGKKNTIITLSADKSTFLANGSEKVTFTVKNQNDENITADCVFVLDNKESSSSSFSTSTPGSYTFLARDSKGLASNKVTVVAVDPNFKLIVKADKSQFVADGGDAVVFTLQDEKGNDLTKDGASFYLDGSLLRSNYARVSKKGTYKVTASWKGQTTKDAIEITAGDLPSTFTGRALFEFSTATTCKFCPDFIKAFRNYTSNPRFALISVHREGSSISIDYYAQKTKDRVQEFVDYFREYNNDQVGWPAAFCNRVGKSQFFTVDEIQNKIPESSNIGISIDAVYERSQFNATATIVSNSDFTGKVVAVLVEDGIYASQTDMGNIAHEKVMRDYEPSVEGAEITLTAGAPLKKSFYFDQLNVKKAENCEIIVFVTNLAKKVVSVQKVAVGKTIGY